MTDSDSFVSWLAGFVDGEGCFHVSRRRSTRPEGLPSYWPVISISNTVRAPLDEIAARLGYGSVSTRPARGRASSCHTYTVSGRRALAFAALVRPHLRVKGYQAGLLLGFKWRSSRAWVLPNDPVYRTQEAVYELLRESKQPGFLDIT